MKLSFNQKQSSVVWYSVYILKYILNVILWYVITSLITSFCSMFDWPLFNDLLELFPTDPNLWCQPPTASQPVKHYGARHFFIWAKNRNWQSNQSTLVNCCSRPLWNPKVNNRTTSWVVGSSPTLTNAATLKG